MPDDKVIDHEIDNWQGFEAVLYKEDREMFAKMILEVKAYANSAKNAPLTTKLVKGSLTSDELKTPAKEPAEALFMTLILLQQKVITKLLDTLAKVEKNKK
jgi:hypothetical protein